VWSRGNGDYVGVFTRGSEVLEGVWYLIGKDGVVWAW
jgi:hypothetical protein